MTPVADITDCWVEALQGIGVGASIAILVLRPAGAPPMTISPTQNVVQYVQPVSSEVDGNQGLRPIFISTAQGLDKPDIEVVSDAASTESEFTTSLVNDLRDEFGLHVETLAAMAGVTRMTFHKWLKGTGIRPGHLAQLNKLRETLRMLRSILGERLQIFLDSPTQSGTPVDMIAVGDLDLAIGYALRPNAPVTDARPSAQTPALVTGLRDWTHPVQPIGWNAQRLTSQQLSAAMNELSPAPTFPDADSIRAHAEDSDEAYTAFGIILE